MNATRSALSAARSTVLTSILLAGLAGVALPDRAEAAPINIYTTARVSEVSGTPGLAPGAQVQLRLNYDDAVRPTSSDRFSSNFDLTDQGSNIRLMGSNFADDMHVRSVSLASDPTSGDAIFIGGERGNAETGASIAIERSLPLDTLTPSVLAGSVTPDRLVNAEFYYSTANGGQPGRFIQGRIFQASSVPPSMVPIPGAVWLMGAGIGSLLGLRRHRNKRRQAASAALPTPAAA